MTQPQLSRSIAKLERELEVQLLQRSDEFGGFDPHVMESQIASAPTLDADSYSVKQGAAIAVMAEETAHGICPPGVTVVPLQPPPGFAVMAAWRRGVPSTLLDRFLGFIRSCRDTNAWSADAARLSPRTQTSIGRLPGRPGFLDLPRA
jgi:DNA-binding transcriptional LysR family regulator